jgi:hypothetical protein
LLAKRKALIILAGYHSTAFCSLSHPHILLTGISIVNNSVDAVHGLVQVWCVFRYSHVIAILPMKAKMEA